MARVVLDTNVLVSAVFAGGKPKQVLERCIRGDDVMLASARTLQEFVDVISRPKFRLSEAEIHDALAAVVGVAHIVAVLKRHHIISEDPDDDHFLDIAVAGHADRIVSGDKHLLALGSFADIPIVTAAQWLRQA